ncbi:MAG: FlgD immunoglobulin-like domain containing protein, partial [Calditrichota bacterium]
NPETNITYQINHKMQIKINILDLQGRLIRNLVNRTQTAGTYTATWDGKNKNGFTQPSGIYFYQMLLEGKNSETKQMLLLR